MTPDPHDDRGGRPDDSSDFAEDADTSDVLTQAVNAHFVMSSSAARSKERVLAAITELLGAFPGSGGQPTRQPGLPTFGKLVKSPDGASMSACLSMAAALVSAVSQATGRTNDQIVADLTGASVPETKDDIEARLREGLRMPTKKKR